MSISLGLRVIPSECNREYNYYELSAETKWIYEYEYDYDYE